MELYEEIDKYIGNIKLQKREEYIKAIINKSYRGLISSVIYARYNKKVLPNKKNNSNPLNYILNNLGYKYCGYCDDILEVKNFALNSCNSYGLQTYCKECQYLTTKPTQAARQSNRRARELNAIPKWSDISAINKIFKECQEGYQVDHIVPLKGKNVCGLHVYYNLQYLTKKENLIKSNKF